MVFQSPGRFSGCGKSEAGPLIGKLYAAGLGTEQDYEEAARWLELSASANYEYAQYTLAAMYRDGKGVEQDYTTALELYTKASSFPYASYELAKMHRDGVGCEANEERAAFYFRQAFTGFQAMAKKAQDDKLQYRIGWMLLHGVGTEQNEAAALPWLGQSAECGNTFAKYTLGKAYLLGQDIPQDHTEAVRWLKLSAEQGNQYAQCFLDHFYDSVFSSAISLLYHMGNILQEQRQQMQ